MTTSSKILAALLGSAVTLVGLILAALLVGPLLRAVMGLPAGYATDVTSRGAFLQAIVAQFLSVVLVFLICGMAMGSRLNIRRWQSASWVANPLSVGIGYWIFRQIPFADWPYEYRAYHGWLALIILAPLILAPCLSLGSRLRQQNA